MKIPSIFHESCETIDAGLFTGDSLFPPTTLSALKEYIERWTRAIAEYESSHPLPNRFDGLQLDPNIEISPCGVYSIGIDLPYKKGHWLSQIECYADSKEEVLELQLIIANALKGNK